jgi:hypothetical protein
MLTPGLVADGESGHLIPTANPIAVAALVVLAGRLAWSRRAGLRFLATRCPG